MTAGQLDTTPDRDSEPAVDSGHGGRRRLQALNARFPRAGTMLLLAVLVLALNGITVHKSEQVSIIDEPYWIDHLVRGSHFQVEHTGDVISQETLRELCTRGYEGGRTPPCHPGHLEPKRYLPGGVNFTGHSPFYFFITGPIARVLRASPIDLSPNDSLVTWGRLLGSAWLLLGVYFTLRAGELLGVKRRNLVIALVLVVASPSLLHLSTIVNPDATAFPAGAAVLWAALAWEQRGKGLWPFALAALVAGALDPTNAVGIMVVLGYLAVRAVWSARGEGDERSRPWKEYAIAAGVVVVAAVLANRGWDQLHTFLIQHDVLSGPRPLPVGVTNPLTDAYSVSHIGATQLFGSQTIFGLIPPFYDYSPPPARSDALYVTFSEGARLLAVGVLALTILREKIVGRLGALGVGLLAALLVTPVLLVLYNWWSTSTYDLIIPRYGLSALPALAIILASAMRNVVARAVVTFVAAGLYLSAIIVVFVD